MKFKLVETVELSEKGNRGQGSIWKKPIQDKNSEFEVNLNNYSLHHINSIHKDNGKGNLAVIPNKLHTDMTREINKRCREYLVKHGILQSISIDVWKDTLKPSDLEYYDDCNLFFIRNQIPTDYSIPEDNQLDLFGEM